MITSLVLFFGLMAAIYLISGQIIQQLYLFPFLITLKKESSINFLSFLLLPGTVIHELAHMIVAELVFVKTGAFSFRPSQDPDGTLHIGSLEFVKTDPFRRTVIGLAPLTIGLTIITGVYYFYLSRQWNIVTIEQLSHRTIEQWSILFAVSYLLFTSSITMFSSQKDLETALVPAIVLVVIIAILWLAGFQLTVPQKIIAGTDVLFTVIDKALVAVIVIDLLGLLALKAINFATKRLFRPHLALS